MTRTLARPAFVLDRDVASAVADLPVAARVLTDRKRSGKLDVRTTDNRAVLRQVRATTTLQGRDPFALLEELEPLLAEPDSDESDVVAATAQDEGVILVTDNEILTSLARRAEVGVLTQAAFVAFLLAT